MKPDNSKILLALAVSLAACGTSPTDRFVEQLNVVISEGNQPIADVEGPYGAVSVKSHLVALRVWPDTLEDGMAEANIIVTNESWNTIELSIDDIALESSGGNMQVIGKPQMLAMLADPGSAPPGVEERDVELLTERQSSRAARSQQGSGGGSRRSGDIEGAMMDPAIASAARLAGSADQSAAASPEEMEQRRQAIESWYLDRIEIYPGDTGVGGISLPLPGRTEDLRLTVSLYGETHTFDLRYVREDQGH